MFLMKQILFEGLVLVLPPLPSTPLKLNLAPVIRAKLTALNNNVICLLTGEVQQGQPQDSLPHPRSWVHRG